ncbi:hypothetical protein M011DRAFT_472589 [Sporormia fimetaria CBS 119925]|uniref:Uncharacterized protein n=1 Tax=Sporormia fimetaria CBS 119925 TaxID=1340428 RepID=A0A6A6UYC7_9PLEO|nr:hypothetical protein M011DRAFT_472589 [Sporormia fimetaria CBS 119925]
MSPASSTSSRTLSPGPVLPTGYQTTPPPPITPADAVFLAEERQAVVIELYNRNNRLVAETASLRANVAELERENWYLKRRATENDQYMSFWAGECEDSDKNVSELKKQLEDVTRQRNAAYTENAVQIGRITRLETKAEEMEKEHQEMEKEREEMQEKRMEIERERREVEEARDELEREQRNLENEKEAVKEERKQMNRDRQAMEQKYREMEDEREQLKLDRDAMEQDFMEMEEEREQMRRDRDAMETGI